METREPIGVPTDTQPEQLMLAENGIIAALEHEMKPLTEAERSQYETLVRDVERCEVEIGQLATSIAEEDINRRGELELIRLARVRFVNRFWLGNSVRRHVYAARAPLIEQLWDIRTALREQGYVYDKEAHSWAAHQPETE